MGAMKLVFGEPVGPVDGPVDGPVGGLRGVAMKLDRLIFDLGEPVPLRDSLDDSLDDSLGASLRSQTTDENV